MARRRKQQESSPHVGHNGAPLNEDQRKKLAGYIKELEHWFGQKAETEEDIRAILQSAKEAGFNVRAIRRVLKDRRQDREEREAFEAVVDSYKHALGDLADTPLGQAALARDMGQGERMVPRVS